MPRLSIFGAIGFIFKPLIGFLAPSTPALPPNLNAEDVVSKHLWFQVSEDRVVTPDNIWDDEAAFNQVLLSPYTSRGAKLLLRWARNRQQNRRATLTRWAAYYERMTAQRLWMHACDLWQFPANKVGIPTNLFYGGLCIFLTIGSAIIHPLPFLNQHVYLFLIVAFCVLALTIESIINTAASFPHSAPPSHPRPLQSNTPSWLRKFWPFLVDFCLPLAPLAVWASSFAQLVWKFTTTYLLLHATYFNPFWSLLLAGTYASFSALGNVLNDRKNLARARHQHKTDSWINSFGKHVKIGTGFFGLCITWMALIVHHAPLGLNIALMLLQFVERLIYVSSTFEDEEIGKISNSMLRDYEDDKARYQLLDNHCLLSGLKTLGIASIVAAAGGQAISRYTLTTLLLHQLGFVGNAHFVAIPVAIISAFTTLMFDRLHYQRSLNHAIIYIWDIEAVKDGDEKVIGYHAKRALPAINQALTNPTTSEQLSARQSTGSEGTPAMLSLNRRPSVGDETGDSPPTTPPRDP